MQIFDQIRKLLNKLEESWKPPASPIRQPTAQKRVRVHGTTTNHGQGVPKYRRQMAARSNRINRKRIRNWKH